MKERKFQNALISAICILSAAIIAILVHALMPSPGAAINTEDFDGILVRTFGFPVVASTYFIILYLHIYLVVRYFGARSYMDSKKIGLRFGAAFALLYFMGMQEVMVEGSPFSSWGLDFVLYQFFMGLGDAIPAFLLCIILAAVAIGTRKSKTSLKTTNSSTHKHKKWIILMIALGFFSERLVGYLLGYIDSDIKRYPIPVLIWTAIFGLIFGIAYVVLRPIYSYNTSASSQNITLLTLGMNWIIFNSFIGMIFAGTILQTLIRSGMDVAVIYLVTLFLEKYKLE